VLFQRGAFTAHDTAATAAALAAYAAGLPAFVLVKVLAPAFFARHDTATPVRIAVAAMAVNLCLTLVLMQFLAHVGIALATTGAGWVNALVLFAVLVRRGDFRLDPRARRSLPRIAAAAVGMSVVLLVLRVAFAPVIAGAGLARIGALAALVTAGIAAFALLALAFGVADLRELRGRLRRQRGLTGAAAGR
jgi:putative peptidoglycan lipid II flippase